MEIARCGKKGDGAAWQSGLLLDLSFAYDSVGNILTITDALNSGQVQSFAYDALNRLTTASTSSVGEGQYSQSYGTTRLPATWLQRVTLALLKKFHCVDNFTIFCRIEFGM
ncbi:MAG: RHS repeat domain-containing protein [Anaerolineaceae bacterium]|jgi:YD repeat-containing protein